MLAKARERSPRSRSVGFKLGRAEALPFKTGWFDRVVLRLVVHLVDRPAALQEAARVLGRPARVVIATFNPQHFESYWLNAFFPDILAIDRSRFPTPATLAEELAAAGFAAPRIRMLRQRGRLRREEALERIRGRFISTLRLLGEDAYAAGLARAEQELPVEIELTTDWSILVAEPL
jgi:SAM-dependent methyltransferase